jgi:hypothetical protein
VGARQNKEIPIPNFTGGQVSAKGIGTYQLNEFFSVKNLILRPGGNGFRSREGNSVLNSTAIGSGLPVAGLGYLKVTAGTEYLVAISGSKIFESTSFSSSFSDITGSISVTAGQDNIWTFFQHNDILIGCGGAPDAPFKYSGSGNAAALGGTPPSARFGFTYGNRSFLMSTSADPSRIYWSTLGNPEDWTGDGSGNAFVETKDGDSLVSAAPLNINTVLLFKQNSTHVMTGRSSPFPILPLFKGIGCAGPRACVVYNGIAYFITSNGKMAATDGNTILKYEHLNDLEDIFGQISSSRMPYIQGVVVNGADFDWIVWSVSYGIAGANNYAIVWDLNNECWLTCPTGFESNAYAVTQNKTIYMGGYDGNIYKLFTAATYTDASNSSSNISWEIESDWIDFAELINVKKIDRLNCLYFTQASGTISFAYGYNYTYPLTVDTFSIASTGSLWDTAIWDQSTWDGYTGNIKQTFPTGYGHAFKWKLYGSSPVSNQISKVSLFGRSNNQKVFKT